MAEGTIIKALSGFYTVRSGQQTLECRARGRFRRDGTSPLVGDRVEVSVNADGSGNVDHVLPRRNFFGRPAIANVDALVVIVSAAIPITDPFLIDRVCSRCEKNGAETVIVINKIDLADGQALDSIYRSIYPTVCVSAKTGEGIDELRAIISGRTSCFTGNSGVGKSSILNALHAELSVETGEVSQKLGRGRHTTRHVELFDLGQNTFIADTPGFAAFENDTEQPIRKQEYADLFPEFREYISQCRFDDCSHRAEPGCALRNVVEQGLVSESRYASYKRLYEEASLLKEWELK